MQIKIFTLFDSAKCVRALLGFYATRSSEICCGPILRNNLLNNSNTLKFTLFVTCSQCNNNRSHVFSFPGFC